MCRATTHGRKAAARSPSFFRHAGSRNKINRCSTSLASFTAATAKLRVGGLELTDKLTNALPLLVALIFVATLPQRHLGTPVFIYRQAIIQAIPTPSVPPEQWYKLSDPIVLTDQVESDESPTSNKTVNTDVRPAWVSFALIVALALHAILDHGFSV